MKFSKSIVLLLIVLSAALVFAGCFGDSGGNAGNQNTAGSSNKGSASETTALSPVIEEITAFRKEDTALKESDVIVIFIRNVAYDYREEAFIKDFKVYLDGQEQAFHDVNPIGADYQAITVDISGISTGNVYVTYGGLKSNQKDFKLE